jgi:hypothetical protein
VPEPDGAPIAGAAPERARAGPPPLATPLQIGTAVGAATVAVFAFLPGVQEASEVSTQFHHLAHAAQFFLGAAVGAAIGSSPSLYPRLASRWSGLGLAAAILAPAAMLMLMIPGVYGDLDNDATLHGAYHLGIAALGAITGLGAAALGQVAGRLVLGLSVGMAVMYAAGVTGG